MNIQFTKGKDGKPDVLTCRRADGSVTWSPSQVGTGHDLIHYAVETTLGYQGAFYGLLAQGRDIQEFGTKDGQQDSYPTEAIWTELVVGLLQWPVVGGGQALSDDVFYQSLAQQCAEKHLSVPSISDGQSTQIRAEMDRLLALWKGIPPGETLGLFFSEFSQQLDCQCLPDRPMRER